jgi:pilus assembly protein CpaE
MQGGRRLNDTASTSPWRSPPAQRDERRINELRTAIRSGILDFDHDPEAAVSFARFLTDGSPQRYIVGAGPQLGAEALLEAMRAGVAEYLPKPLADHGVKAALDRAARRLGCAPTSREPGQLYTLFSPKGGAGTTSVATNLAVVLQRLSGKRTLLVDLDFELGEIAVLLGMQPRFSFLTWRRTSSHDVGLLSSFIDIASRASISLSAPFHPEPADTPDATRSARSCTISRQYDHVIVDTPKSFSWTPGRVQADACSS